MGRGVLSADVSCCGAGGGSASRRAIVLGAGRSGRAAGALLRQLGHEVLTLDGGDAFPCGDGTGAYGGLAVVSPGIALTHPWIAAARRCGIPLKSELQLGCEELRRRGWKLLAVTGSKGKSSVVKVVADALGGVPCGNYGTPVCDVAVEDLRCGTADGRCRWAVVEVSSFMMETTELPADTFEAAAILNLQEDHLDRHGSIEAYHGLKRKLLAFASRSFVGGGGASAPQAGRLWNGSCFDNDVLWENAAIAAELMRVAGLADAAIARAFAAFKPLPHRMNLVAERNGVRYVDDSKATSIAALVAGVKMASSGNRPSARPNGRTILLIAGGLPKGDDPKSALPTLTERVKKVYLIGQCAEAFRTAWENAVDCEVCGSLDRAVERAACEAGRGETVLLSPGTASFDQFQSFEKRGEAFARLVKGEGQQK